LTAQAQRTIALPNSSANGMMGLGIRYTTTTTLLPYDDHVEVGATLKHISISSSIRLTREKPLSLSLSRSPWKWSNALQRRRRCSCCPPPELEPEPEPEPVTVKNPASTKQTQHGTVCMIQEEARTTSTSLQQHSTAKQS
jgi:hypothetical protein